MTTIPSFSPGLAALLGGQQTGGTLAGTAIPGVDPALFDPALLDPSLLNPELLRLLTGASGPALPGAQPPTGAQLPLQARMDPRQAMGQLTDAATLSTPWSQAEIDAGIAARYPDLKNSLALNQQLQGAVNQGNQLLGGIMGGQLSREQVVQQLGGGAGAEEYAAALFALAAAIQSGDPSLIRSAAGGANAAMVKNLGGGAGQQRALQRVFGGEYGGGRAYNGQGAFGREIMNRRGDVFAPNGEFTARSPSEVGASALQAATSQVGIHESSGIPAQRYSNGRNQPWCADFATWALGQASPDAARRYGSSSAREMENKFRSAGNFFSSGSAEPKPGDLIFFQREGGSGRHVGIVREVRNGRVYTVEGNSGNQVRERSYELGNGRIVGYGRP